MDWFLYDIGLGRERVKLINQKKYERFFELPLKFNTIKSIKSNPIKYNNTIKSNFSRSDMYKI